MKKDLISSPYDTYYVTKKIKKKCVCTSIVAKPVCGKSCRKP